MSKKMAGIVMAYGVVLATLGFVIQQVAPALAQVSFVTGLAGGGLCMVWGLVALAGHKRRVGAILTLIALILVMLGQVIPAWSSVGGETSGSLAASLVLTFIVLLTVGMLMYLLHGERPPEFYMTGTVRRDVASLDGGKNERDHGSRQANNPKSRH
jgi:uncharacterized YccA/Bax inhibitor family protein